MIGRNRNFLDNEVFKGNIWYVLAYDVVYTNVVGTIVYEDDWQVAVSVEAGKML